MKLRGGCSEVSSHDSHAEIPKVQLVQDGGQELRVQQEKKETVRRVARNLVLAG